MILEVWPKSATSGTVGGKAEETALLAPDVRHAVIV